MSRLGDLLVSCSLYAVFFEGSEASHACTVICMCVCCLAGSTHLRSSMRVLSVVESMVGVLGTEERRPGGQAEQLAAAWALGTFLCSCCAVCLAVWVAQLGPELLGRLCFTPTMLNWWLLHALHMACTGFDRVLLSGCCR